MYSRHLAASDHADHGSDDLRSTEESIMRDGFARRVPARFLHVLVELIGARSVHDLSMCAETPRSTPATARSHDYLRRVLERLLDSMRVDAPDVRALWGELEHGLLTHMEAEERFVLPAFLRVDRDEPLRRCCANTATYASTRCSSWASRSTFTARATRSRTTSPTRCDTTRSARRTCCTAGPTRASTTSTSRRSRPTSVARRVTAGAAG